MPEAVAAPVTGRIFEIQRFSIHDGPGIRTTVFLQGCPLRCLWCHNPEGLEARPVLMFRPDKCIGCGYCFRTCPREAHEMRETEGGMAHVLDRGRCERCGACAKECYSGAIEYVGREASVAEVLEKVLRDRPFYETSGGGMTLSGGEPLAQMAFAKALLLAARDEGLHTAVETSAYGPWTQIAEIAPMVSLFLVDLKHIDDGRHRALTGVSNATILANIAELIRRGNSLALRIPWVPGINTDDAFLDGLLDYLGQFSAPPPVELMLYHRLGGGKWRALGEAMGIPESLPNATAQDAGPWLAKLAERGIDARTS